MQYRCAAALSCIELSWSSCSFSSTSSLDERLWGCMSASAASAVRGLQVVFWQLHVAAYARHLPLSVPDQKYRSDGSRYVALCREPSSALTLSSGPVKGQNKPLSALHAARLFTDACMAKIPQSGHWRTGRSCADRAARTEPEG